MWRLPGRDTSYRRNRKPLDTYKICRSIRHLVGSHSPRNNYLPQVYSYCRSFSDLVDTVGGVVLPVVHAERVVQSGYGKS
jgi:hypothetical protein